MGLDVGSGFFGVFHVNWAGSRWFREWCRKEGLPDPFIGWVSGDNSGDECILGPKNAHSRQAKAWCRALVEVHPELAELGNELILRQRMIDPYEYLYPGGRDSNALSEEEWSRRAIALWYAILKHGVEHGDTLAYC